MLVDWCENPHSHLEEVIQSAKLGRALIGEFNEERSEAVCLAIPGKMLEPYLVGGLRMAKVEFGGITRNTCVEYLPEAKAGDYVLVHVGFALSIIDADEAERTYKLLAEMGQLDELQTPTLDDAQGEV